METIKSSAEITNLFNEGRRIGTKDLTLIVLRNEGQHGQCGRAAFIAGKRLGNAVWRNRAKRRMRALCQAIGGPMPGYDTIYLAKRSTNIASFDAMKSSLTKALTKIQ
ncbi:MAG: ribonuclease P protein component [Eggerthellaceae bacterium]|nr:ribonuclease P protein component [Eggerthellaceae bacterium]